MSRDDPYASSNFIVEISGIAVAGFSEVSGLGFETAVIEYRNGNEAATPRKVPGLHKVSNITLKRGVTKSQELWAWRKTVLEGKTERRSGSIILLDEAREEVLRWNFYEGWVCKWEGPAFNAKSNEIAIEMVEICHERLELASD